MKQTRVVHVDKAPYTIYIGRSVKYGGPSKWANPFRIGKDGSREEVIWKYKHYGLQHGFNKLAKEELSGETLGCHCAPEACHGHVLADWANN